jgi:glyoxylase-like metal-dependent hydrolase (beta-lactamase superfamily II)
MNVRVLGCHGSGQLVPGANGPIQCGTCGFLVNDQLLVDAGTIGSRLFLDEQRRIRVVLLTHLHFDHIRELPTLADNLVGEIDEPVVIAAIPEVLDGLRAHIFNGTVYPDFFRLARSRQAGVRPLRVASGTRGSAVRDGRDADSRQPCRADRGISPSRRGAQGAL